MRILTMRVRMLGVLSAVLSVGCGNPEPDGSPLPGSAGIEAARPPIGNAPYNWGADPGLTAAQKAILAGLQAQSGPRFEAEPWEHGQSVYRLDLNVPAPPVGGKTMSDQRIGSALAFVQANAALWNLPAPVNPWLVAINYDPICDNVTLQALNAQGLPVFNALLRVSFQSINITEVIGRVDGRHLGVVANAALPPAQAQVAFIAAMAPDSQWQAPGAPPPPVPTQVVYDPLYNGDLAAGGVIAYAFGLNQTSMLSDGGPGGYDATAYAAGVVPPTHTFTSLPQGFSSTDGQGITQRLPFYIVSGQGTGNLMLRGEGEVLPFRAVPLAYTPPGGAVAAGDSCNPDPVHWMPTISMPATSKRAAPITPTYVGLGHTARTGTAAGGIGVHGATPVAQAYDLLSNPLISAMYGDASPATHLQNPTVTTDSSGEEVVTFQEVTDDGLPVDGAYQSVVIAPANRGLTGFDGVAIAIHSKFLYFPTIAPKLAVIKSTDAVTAATTLYLSQLCPAGSAANCATTVNGALAGWNFNATLEVAASDIYPYIAMPAGEPLGLVWRLEFPTKTFLWSAEVSGVAFELPNVEMSPPNTIFNDSAGLESTSPIDFQNDNAVAAVPLADGDTKTINTDVNVGIFNFYKALGFLGVDQAGAELISEFADWDHSNANAELCISPTVAGVQFTLNCGPLCRVRGIPTSCSLNLPSDATIGGKPVSPGQNIHMLTGQVVDDRIAHEYTHGITWNTARLWDFSDETGALNESYSDVFSQLIFPNADGTWHTNTKAGVLNNLEEPNKDGLGGSPMTLAQEIGYGCSTTCSPGAILDAIPTGDCQHCWASINSLAVALASDGQRIVKENQKDFAGSMANGACAALPLAGVGGRNNLSQALFDTLTTRLQQADRFVNQAIDLVEVCNGDLATVPGLTAQDCETLQNAYTCVGIDPGYVYGTYTAVACSNLLSGGTETGTHNTFQADPGGLYNMCTLNDLTLNGQIGNSAPVTASFDNGQSVNLDNGRVTAAFACGGVTPGTVCATARSYQVNVNTAWNMCWEVQQIPGANQLGAQWIPPQDQADNMFTLWVTEKDNLGPGLLTPLQCDSPFGSSTETVCSTNVLAHWATALNGESGTDTINAGLMLNPQCSVVSVQGQNGDHGNFATQDESMDVDYQQVCYIVGCTTIGVNHFWGGPCLGSWNCAVPEPANPQSLSVAVSWEHNGTSEVEMRPVYTISVPTQGAGGAPPPNCLAGLPLVPCQ